MTWARLNEWSVKCQTICFFALGLEMFHLYVDLFPILSAILGHHCHCCGCRFTYSNVLLLHRQKMLLQEEEEQEGQEGEGWHGDEEPQRWRGMWHCGGVSHFKAFDFDEYMVNNMALYLGNRIIQGHTSIFTPTAFSFPISRWVATPPKACHFVSLFHFGWWRLTFRNWSSFQGFSKTISFNLIDNLHFLFIDSTLLIKDTVLSSEAQFAYGRFQTCL